MNIASSKVLELVGNLSVLHKGSPLSNEFDCHHHYTKKLGGPFIQYPLIAGG